MLNPDLRELLKDNTSRYSLVTAVAKRARMLSDENEEKYTDYQNVCDKPVSIAVHEIAEGKIDIINEK